MSTSNENNLPRYNTNVGRQGRRGMALKTTLAVCVAVVAGIVAFRFRQEPSATVVPSLIEEPELSTEMEKETYRFVQEEGYYNVEPADTGESLIAMQFNSPDPHAGQDKLSLILDGTLTLTDCDVRPNSLEGDDGGAYKNVKCTFCDIGAGPWSAQQSDPSVLPEFRDVAASSYECDQHPYNLDLNVVVAAARQSDANAAAPPSPAGFIFGQARAGATVLSNAITVAGNNRVFANHPAVEAAMDACDKADIIYKRSDCSFDKQVELLRDIVYLLTRSVPSPTFFQMNPKSTTNMKVSKAAFPDIKWAFVYRNPDTVLAKNLQRKRNGCVKSRNNASKALKIYVEEMGISNIKSLSDAEVCSALLAAQTKTAVAEHAISPDTSLLVSYDTDIKVKNKVVGIMENFFGMTLDGPRKDKVMKQLDKKSKSRGGSVEYDETEITNVPGSVTAANNKFLGKIQIRTA